ncbi:nucleoredoxin-like [Clytia hemisphaerica]|uniref:protein-disulfide reductase n=1 Tax=Clytia hemisphaerica TaxID=252671 RepID=A0A7M5WJ36_9CNID|eukprot:TCONS_00030746-protein
MVVELIKGKKFLTQKGEQIAAEKVLKDHKIICFYFSAHWCPPCRGFTPVLKDFYQEVGNEGDIAIIFVSSDRDEEQCKSYFNEHGDYLCLPYAERALKQKLSEKFEVKGIPTLVVCRSDGKLVTKQGRAEVMSKEPRALKREWLS